MSKFKVPFNFTKLSEIINDIALNPFTTSSSILPTVEYQKQYFDNTLAISSYVSSLSYNVVSPKSEVGSKSLNNNFKNVNVLQSRHHNLKGTSPILSFTSENLKYSIAAVTNIAPDTLYLTERSSVSAPITNVGNIGQNVVPTLTEDINVSLEKLNIIANGGKVTKFTVSDIEIIVNHYSLGIKKSKKQEFANNVYHALATYKQQHGL